MLCLVTCRLKPSNALLRSEHIRHHHTPLMGQHTLETP